MVGRSRPDLRRAVMVLIVANLAVVGALASSDIPGVKSLAHPYDVLLFGAAFAVVGKLRVRLEFSQHRVRFTLAEAVLVIGLFHLSPFWLAIAAGAGEAAGCLIGRTPALKAGFNAASHAGTATVAGTAFLVCHAGAPNVVGAWLAALVAVSCWGTLNALAVSAVIAVAEDRRFTRTLSSSLPTAVATTVVGTSLGLLLQQLWDQGPLYPLLALPLAAGVWLNGHYAAAQRDEHLRVERLYEATARTAGLQASHDVAAGIAEEARRLLTGLSAICLLRDGGGVWESSLAAPGGVEDGHAVEVEQLLEYAATPGGSSTVTPLPQCFQSMAPDGEMLVVARSPEGSEVDLVLAVLRRGSSKGRDYGGLGDTLAAYVAHGAVAAAKAGLVAKLQRSLEAEMQANQRKDEFVATISHELRTPLTVVIGAVQTLLRLQDRVQPADRDRLLHRAEDQGQRLRLLIEDLLLVAAAEQGKLRCDIAAFSSSQLAADLRSDLPEQLRGLVRIDNTDPDVVAVSDRYKVRQIITNLFANAAKYAPGSPIAIALSWRCGQLQISVIDHGPGIPPAERERVFQRFVQLDQSSTRSMGGAGLGLFICKMVANQLGATLELTETEGGGCTFTLGLPSAGTAPSALAGASDFEARPPASRGLLRRPATPLLVATASDGLLVES